MLYGTNKALRDVFGAIGCLAVLGGVAMFCLIAYGLWTFIEYMARH